MESRQPILPAWSVYFITAAVLFALGFIVGIAAMIIGVSRL